MRKSKRTWFVTAAALGLLVMGGASMPAKMNIHARMNMDAKMNMRARTMSGGMVNAMRIMPSMKGVMPPMRVMMTYAGDNA